MNGSRIVAVVGLATMTLALAVTSVVQASSDEPATSGGDAVVVEANAALRELDSGGSATLYSLRLPDGAACPGDTRNDQWAFQTFMVPAEVDPASLEFSSAGPTGPSQYALYEEGTQPLVDAILVPNAEPGLPGRVPPIPPLTFSIFPPGEIAAGTYRIGVACTFLREPATFWQATIVVESDAGDEPGQFTWRTDGSVAATTSGDSSSLPLVAAAVGAGALAATVLLVRRRTRSSTPSKEYVS
jgi:hypothetical protein